MVENIGRRSAGHRIKDISDDDMNLLLDQWVPHSLDKSNNGRKVEAVFLDQYKRTSTSTITTGFPSESFDNLYFLGVRQMQGPKTREKVIKYHKNFS